MVTLIYAVSSENILFENSTNYIKVLQYNCSNQSLTFYFRLLRLCDKTECFSTRISNSNLLVSHSKFNYEEYLVCSTVDRKSLPLPVSQILFSLKTERIHAIVYFSTQRSLNYRVRKKLGRSRGSRKIFSSTPQKATFVENSFNSFNFKKQ